MKKAGGIIGLIGGIFGVFAAIVTLVFGGIGAVVAAKSANTMIGLGWGGLLFSFLCIVFGAIAISAKGKTAGGLLVAASVLGAILGGTFVAVCMVLSLIGGILVVASKSQPSELSDSSGSTKSSSSFLKWTGIGVGALLVAVVGFGMLFGKKDSTSTANSGGSQAEVSDSLDAAPYTQEMNRKIDRVGKSIETPALQGESSTVQLQRMVEYFNKGYAKAGYSFDKSLVRYVEYMKKTNNVPDLRPEAQPMYQAFAFVAGMASSGADLNVALPGPTLAPVREYFAPKTASVESKPIPAVEVAQPATATTQTPQAENKAEPDPVEKDGICKGLNLMQTNHQIECHERRYAVADQELNANYKDVVTKLDPAQKTKLRDLQRAWIKERDSTCAKELEGGGTMAMVNASGCKFQMTEARAAFLKTYKP